MPKKQIFGSILILIILSFVCIFIYDQFKDVKEDKKNRLVVEKGNFNLTLYYTDSDKRNYYLYGIDKIIVDYMDHSLELDNALEAKQITMDQVIELIGMENKNSYQDGGSTKISNQELSLLQCQTIDGNHDYYFGPSDMSYREGFCKSIPYICSFVKTYYISDISNSNDKKYSYLTLREFEGEEVVTIKVNKNLTSGIQEDNYYEFQFGSLTASNKIDIKSLFESHVLLSITLAEKQGLEQKNEDICR